MWQDSTFENTKMHYSQKMWQMRTAEVRGRCMWQIHVADACGRRTRQTCKAKPLTQLQLL